MAVKKQSAKIAGRPSSNQPGLGGNQTKEKKAEGIEEGRGGVEQETFVRQNAEILSGISPPPFLLLPSTFPPIPTFSPTSHLAVPPA